MGVMYGGGNEEAEKDLQFTCWLGAVTRGQPDRQTGQTDR